MRIDLKARDLNSWLNTGPSGLTLPSGLTSSEDTPSPSGPRRYVPVPGPGVQEQCCFLGRQSECDLYHVPEVEFQCRQLVWASRSQPPPQIRDPSIVCSYLWSGKLGSKHEKPSFGLKNSTVCPLLKPPVIRTA